MLAENDCSFRGTVEGYLVEHMWVGDGIELRLEYREVPYISVQNFVVQYTPAAAGHMVVTRYTL